MSIQDAPDAARKFEVSSGVSLISLPAGTYQFSVRTAQPVRMEDDEGIFLPAIHVGLGPGAPAENVEFIPGPHTANGWLYEAENTLVANITGAAATLVITSIRSPHGRPLHIDVEQLSGDRERQAMSGRMVLPGEEGSEARLVPARIVAHIRNRGDVTFEDSPWAGRLGRGFSIEAFSVVPSAPLGAADVEYKALTATGFETPWLSNGASCGTQGMGIPLVGFAVRLKPGPVASRHQLEYSGQFASGRTVGPLRNGAPCRSSAPADALEGIRVRIAENAPAAQKEPAKVPEPKKPQRRGKPQKLARGKLRVRGVAQKRAKQIG